MHIKALIMPIFDKFLRMKPVFILAFVFIGLITQAQGLNLSDKSTTDNLVKLLDDREQLFLKYEYQIQTRSGIFGNQTKEDILASNKVLLQVIDADNAILNELDRVMKSQRSDAAQTQIESGQKEIQLQNYRDIMDRMNAQANQNSERIKLLERHNLIAKYLAMVAALAAVLFFILWRFVKR
jgi:hypothetical protein